MTTIAIFGATGRTGKPFTELPLKNGHHVRALVRSRSKLDIDDAHLTVIEGDLSDPARVEETIRGAEAVLLLVGMSPSVRKPPHLRETAARNVVAAMKTTLVKRDDLIATDYKQDNPQAGNGLDTVKALFAQLGPVDVVVRNNR